MTTLDRLYDELDAENARLRAEVARLTLDGIHSCHDDCPRLPCVQRREIERLTAERDRLQDANVREWREIERLRAALERIAEGHEYDPGHYRYEHDELAKIARAALAGTIGDTNADTGADRAPEPASAGRTISEAELAHAVDVLDLDVELGEWAASVAELICDQVEKDRAADQPGDGQ